MSDRPSTERAREALTAAFKLADDKSLAAGEVFAAVNDARTLSFRAFDALASALEDAKQRAVTAAEHEAAATHRLFQERERAEDAERERDELREALRWAAPHFGLPGHQCGWSEAKSHIAAALIVPSGLPPLIEALEAFLDLNYGYLDYKVKDAIEPVIAALAAARPVAPEGETT